MPGRRVCLATGAVALAPSLGAAGPFVCVCVCFCFFAAIGIGVGCLFMYVLCMCGGMC